MDIARLTIQGFKSFYEKSVFTFDKNITGIVGPNGSGKSNITEAIRFVLGEQSAKSMRGKDATDLLFRGANVKAAKASVAIDFVKSKKFQSKVYNTENIFVKNALEKDEVTVSRTIFADGKGVYMMNGVEVRLKDLTEFLLLINVGNKSNWHISQGEADRVLLANNQERRTLIEDALGLKIYHARINESLRKLEKTKENIKEATYARKEILPELASLSKQVEKIKRSSEWRTELTEKASLYIHLKDKEIKEVLKEDKLGLSKEEIENKIKNLESEIILKQKNLNTSNRGDISVLEMELSKEKRVLEIILSEAKDLQEKVANANNNLKYFEIEIERNIKELDDVKKELGQIANIGNDIVFPEKNILEMRDNIEDAHMKILNASDLDIAKDVMGKVDFNFKHLITKGSIVSRDNVKQITYLQSIKNRIEEKLESIKSQKIEAQKVLDDTTPAWNSATLKEKLVRTRLEDLQKEILEFKFLQSESEKEIQRMNFEMSELHLKLREKENIMHKVEMKEVEKYKEMEEFKQILGTNFLQNISSENLEDKNEEEISSLKRSIERLKIRLEESMVANPEEIENNYQNLTEKDAFLLKEIEDLERSVENLNILITDLRNNLKSEFDLGLLQINNVFDSYVKRLFGGGGGKVYVVEIENKKRNDEEDEDEEEAKIGVEVEVEIPKKKVKGLQSLSGGERALVSIALNFSIINQNPAPFMILDETDAALDEANSKRYGEILDMLKNQTKLIVVTHNRETMHFADQIYGVTLHKDGHSKILSVSFDDAIEYAK